MFLFQSLVVKTNQNGQCLYSTSEQEKVKIKICLSDEAEWMSYFNEQKQKAQDFKSEINCIDKEIDQMVYELYGLSEEEIEIVDQSLILKK